MLKILLQRHVESVFNQEASKSVEATGKVEDRLRWAREEDMVDSNITELGHSQGQKAAEVILDWPSIKFVFLSPLRRCVLTTELTLANYPGEIKRIKAEGLFRERLNASCDLPSKTIELRRDHQNIDFSFMDSYPFPEIWFLYTCPKRQEELIFKHEKMAQESLNRDEIFKKTLSEVIDKIEQEPGTAFENFKDLRARVGDARKRLSQLLGECEKELGRSLKDNEVLICAHSSFLYSFTSTEFDSITGRGKNGFKMSNGEIREFTFVFEA